MKRFMKMKKRSSLFLLLLIAIYILEGPLQMVQAAGSISSENDGIMLAEETGTTFTVVLPEADEANGIPETLYVTAAFDETTADNFIPTCKVTEIKKDSTGETTEVGLSAVTSSEIFDSLIGGWGAQFSAALACSAGSTLILEAKGDYYGRTYEAQEGTLAGVVIKDASGNVINATPDIENPTALSVDTDTKMTFTAIETSFTLELPAANYSDGGAITNGLYVRIAFNNTADDETDASYTVREVKADGTVKEENVTFSTNTSGSVISGTSGESVLLSADSLFFNAGSTVTITGIEATDTTVVGVLIRNNKKIDISTSVYTEENPMDLTLGANTTMTFTAASTEGGTTDPDTTDPEIVDPGELAEGTSLTLTLPEGDNVPEQLYVSVELLNNTGGSAPAPYELIVVKSDGTIDGTNTSITFNQVIMDYIIPEASDWVRRTDEVAFDKGTSITISDIDANEDTVVGIKITDGKGNNLTSYFDTSIENPTKLTVDENTKMVFTMDSTVQIPKVETVSTTGNYFQTTSTATYNGTTLLDLLNDFNVFSFNDIEGTHIMGAFVAQNEAYYTDAKNNEDASYLQGADYTRGVSSYVGNITNSYEEPSFKLTYTYCTSSILYTGSTTELTYVSANDLREMVHIIDSDIADFASPNWGGSAEIHYNDDYIDFDEYYDIIMDGSYELLSNGTLEGYYIEPQYYDSREDNDAILRVDLGDCWNITDASNLEEIQITLPVGTTYYDVQDQLQLTVNFLCMSINPIEVTIDGETEIVSQFPKITFGNDTEGYDEYDTRNLWEGEYNEYGNKIIWNMPYINGKIITLLSAKNLAGHMIMPNAEFWNYSIGEDNTLSWHGGNINGIVIAQDVHLGTTEMHMWAYGGLAEKTATYIVTADKTINTGEPGGFDFELVASENNPDGCTNTNLPITATSNASGEITFSPLYFNEAGIYEFTISEAIPDNTGNITYDKSEYLLSVEVVEENKTVAGYAVVTLTATGTITKVKDVNGEEVNENVDSITFNNIIDPTQANCSIEAWKTVDGEKPNNESYEFKLEYQDVDNDGYLGATTITETSNATSGKIIFQNLCFDKEGTYIFYLSEVIPPADERGDITYDETKYLVTVKVTKDESNNLSAVTTIEKIEDITGEIVTIAEEEIPLATFNNLKEISEPFEFPTTGGTGTTRYVTFGLALMFVSLVLYRKRNIEVIHIERNK